MKEKKEEEEEEEEEWSVFMVIYPLSVIPYILSVTRIAGSRYLISADGLNKKTGSQPISMRLHIVEHK